MQAREKMSEDSGVAIGRSRRVVGSRGVGLGRMRGCGVVGEVGAGAGAVVVVVVVWVLEKEGMGEVRWREKLRKLAWGRERGKGEMVLARDVRLLLRTLEKVGVAGVVFAVQKLLLRVLLLVEEEDEREEELVPLLILRILEKAPMLLMGGLEMIVIDSRQSWDSGAAYSYISVLLVFLPCLNVRKLPTSAKAIRLL